MVTAFKTRHWVNRTISTPLHKTATWVVKLDIGAFFQRWTVKMLNLENLQSHLTRFDLIVCYKIIFGLVCINADDFFEFRVSNTWRRGHSYKLYQQFSNCTSRSKCFSERVVTLWNSLPGDRVNFSSLHKFKSLKSINLIV